MLIQKINFESLSPDLVNSIKNFIDTADRKDYKPSSIGKIFDQWWNTKVSLMEKAVVTRTFISSGLIEEDSISELMYKQFDLKKDQIYKDFYPQGSLRLSLWAQLCRRYSDGQFVGIVPVPNRWYKYNRGMNLIYTFPGYSWTMRFFKFKEGADTSNPITALRYEDLELIEEKEIEGDSWYRIDFTQDLLTEEFWQDELVRFGIGLR